jgi:hypothetical protein
VITDGSYVHGLIDIFFRRNIQSYSYAKETSLSVSHWSRLLYVFHQLKVLVASSRAVQIGMNLSVLEEWVGKMALPRGVQSHFAPVRDLLNWLQVCIFRLCHFSSKFTDLSQCLSAITDFSNLVATIQTLKNINPLQVSFSRNMRLQLIMAAHTPLLDATCCARLQIRSQREEE